MALLSKRIIIIIIVFVFLKSGLFAQSSASATTSATITEEVGAAKLSDINIETISGSSKENAIRLNSTGIVYLNRDIRIIESCNATEVASFNIIGNIYAYAITLPSTAILQRKGGTQKLEIGLFNFINDSSQTLNIGAILKLPASQAAGLYTTLTPILLTINYN